MYSRSAVLKMWKTRLSQLCQNEFKELLTARQFSTVTPSEKLQKSYDAVIIGGGHNGLVSAAYLAKAGLKVCVLERREIVGGAAVTEEIIPGFKFSRASYLLSLFRPQIMEELRLKDFGLRYHIKDPTSFTPMLNSDKSLTMGSDMAETQRQIAQFSAKDAEAYPHYEEMLNSLLKALDPLIDLEPIPAMRRSKFATATESLKTIRSVASMGLKNGLTFYELMTAPVSKILWRWFESEPLIATLATDGVIGAMVGPDSPGTGYVLLHHVMGELDGKKGAWAFVIGGNGAVSDAICASAMSSGAEIYTSKIVDKITTDSSNKVTGVVLEGGREIGAKILLSNATPHTTFLKLAPKSLLPLDFLKSVKSIDYTSPVTKINVAVNKLPQFNCLKSQGSGILPQHQTTVHINSEDTQLIHNAYIAAMNGTYAKRPVIEMTIPSSVDTTLAPSGCHTFGLFTQYTPYQLSDGRSWDEAEKKKYAETVFNNIEQYCDGFVKSVVGYEVLTPPDLERIFGLTGGNIFHGSMSLDQLYFTRPTIGHSNYRTPISGLYLCGSGAHPGGGVMGSPGRLSALAAIYDM